MQNQAFPAFICRRWETLVQGEKEELERVMARLRAKNGCPWDRGADAANPAAVFNRRGI